MCGILRTNEVCTKEIEEALCDPNCKNEKQF